MAPPPAAAPRPKPSITDMMKNPGKVVMMMNMVGPGEVDAELEPEVKEECETKYGDIVKVKCNETKLQKSNSINLIEGANSGEEWCASRGGCSYLPRIQKS